MAWTTHSFIVQCPYYQIQMGCNSFVAVHILNTIYYLQGSINITAVCKLCTTASKRKEMLELFYHRVLASHQRNQNETSTEYVIISPYLSNTMQRKVETPGKLCEP